MKWFQIIQLTWYRHRADFLFGQTTNSVASAECRILQSNRGHAPFQLLALQLTL